MRNKKGQFKKGHKPPHKGRKMSPEGIKNVIASHRRPDYKGKGKTHYNWQGGKRKKDSERISWQYQDMRKRVLERDGHKCVLCGCKELKKLRIDHIKPFIFFPELRLVDSNCRTLCRKCDYKFGFNYLRDKHLYQSINE